jgi:hypothetical protein
MRTATRGRRGLKARATRCGSGLVAKGRTRGFAPRLHLLRQRGYTTILRTSARVPRQAGAGCHSFGQYFRWP